MDYLSLYAFLWLLGILTTHLRAVQGHLLIVPNDTIACLGDTVQLNCSTNLTYIIQWMFGHPRDFDSKVINEPTSDGKGYIRRFFAERFSVIRPGNGFHNLNIVNTTFSDAGIYTCIDDQGFGVSDGRWSVASLNVTDCLRSSTATSDFNESHTGGATSVIITLIIICIIVLVGVVLAVLLFLQRRKLKDHMTSNEIENNPLNDLQTGEERSFNAKSFMDNTRLLGVTHEGQFICGLTVLNNQLFVIRGWSTRVSVYDTNNLTHTYNIPIPGSKALLAIVANPQYNCLYLSDNFPSIVYRYNLSDMVITEWTVGGLCHGLSLTSIHNVLATLCDSRLIKEYTADGSLVREISLDSSIVEPLHSVQLSNDQFVVSHGGHESLNRVCIVDTSGHIIQSYGGAEGSDVGQLNQPHHLAVDRHDNVLVADTDNNRIVLLSHSLTHLGYITIPGHKLSDPRALHLDLLTGRLYIGEFKGRVVAVTV